MFNYNKHVIQSIVLASDPQVRYVFFCKQVIYLVTALIITVVLFTSPAYAQEAKHLRYLAINVGNASPQFKCWEYKLCRAKDVKNIRNYIATWKPDIIMLSEVYRAEQLTGNGANEPILPQGYIGMCGESRDRYTNKLAKWNAENASHEHECVAWNSRLSLIANSAKSAYGRNDAYGLNYVTTKFDSYENPPPNCNYDFTGFRVQLMLEGEIPITAVAMHPNSSNATCRIEEIKRYWSTLAEGNRVIIGGDWNTNSNKELQKPESFLINYLRGQHWNIVKHSHEYSAKYFFNIVKKQLDHTFSNFGNPCTTCGSLYGTANLTYGSALGGYDNHPRADNGNGLDHRQILVDLTLTN
jgi:hypothetical protein